MKVLFTIIVCKILRIIGKIVGKGSSLPGKIALKICPDILERVSLPKYIPVVNGIISILSMLFPIEVPC